MVEKIHFVKSLTLKILQPNDKNKQVNKIAWLKMNEIVCSILAFPGYNFV